MYTHSRHLVTNSYGYVKQRYRSDKSEFSRRGTERTLSTLLHSPIELPKTQDGEIHLTSGLYLASSPGHSHFFNDPLKSGCGLGTRLDSTLLLINPAMLCNTFSETVCWQWLGTIILAR